MSRVTGRWDDSGVRRMVDGMARNAVTAGARAGRAQATAIAAQRQQTGGMSDIQIEPARRNSVGWIAGFFSPRYHAWWQNYGTLGSREKPVKQPSRRRRTSAPGTGVKPLYFLNQGLGAGRRAMYRALGIR